MSYLKRFGLLCTTLLSLNYGCSTSEEIKIKEPEKNFELTSAKFFGRDKDSIIKPIISLSLDVQAGMPINKIERIPERMRTVKGTYGQDILVNGNSVSPGTLTDFRFGKLGLETRLHERFFFDIYGAGNIHCSYLFGGFGLHEHDENLQKDFSKEGHKRAYFGAGYEPFFIPELRGDFHLKLTEKGDEWFVLGGGYREYGLEVINGIDTLGDPDFPDKRFKIGDIKESSVYVAIESMSVDWALRWGIRFGAGFVDYEKKNRDVEVDVNKIFPFGGLYLELRF